MVRIDLCFLKQICALHMFILTKKEVNKVTTYIKYLRLN